MNRTSSNSNVSRHQPNENDVPTRHRPYKLAPAPSTPTTSTPRPGNPQAKQGRYLRQASVEGHFVLLLSPDEQQTTQQVPNARASSQTDLNRYTTEFEPNRPHSSSTQLTKDSSTDAGERGRMRSNSDLPRTHYILEPPKKQNHESTDPKKQESVLVRYAKQLANETLSDEVTFETPLKVYARIWQGKIRKHNTEHRLPEKIDPNDFIAVRLVPKHIDADTLRANVVKKASYARSRSVDKEVKRRARKNESPRLRSASSTRTHERETFSETHLDRSSSVYRLSDNAQFINEEFARLCCQPDDLLDTRWPARLAYVPVLHNRLQREFVLRCLANPDDGIADPQTRRQIAADRSALVVQACIQANVPDEQANGVLTLLQNSQFWLEPPTNTTSVENTTKRVGQILARSEYGFDALCLLTGLSSDRQKQPQVSALRVQLQSTDYASSVYEKNSDACLSAIQTSQAASAHIAGDQLSPEQAEALFNWTQSVPIEDGNITLSNMQHALHRFKWKTLFRTNEESSKRDSVKRYAGKHLGPLRSTKLSGAPTAEQQAELAIRNTTKKLLACPELSFEAISQQIDPVETLVAVAFLKYWLDAPAPTVLLDANRVRAIIKYAWLICNSDDETSTRTLSDIERQLLVLTDMWLTTKPYELIKNGVFNRFNENTWNTEWFSTFAQSSEGLGSPEYAQLLDELSEAETNLAELSAKANEDVLSRRNELQEQSAARLARAQTQARQSLRQILIDLKKASRIRLADGLKAGVDSKRLPNVGSNLVAVGSPVTPYVEAEATNHHEEVVEFTRSSDGIEIFIGRANKKNAKISAGVDVGLTLQGGVADVRAGVRAGVTPLDYDRDSREGLIVRIARRPLKDHSDYDDALLEQKAFMLVDNLLEQATSGQPTPKDDWKLLATQYCDDPDFSIGWITSKARTFAVGATARAGVSARALYSVVGASASVTASKVLSSRAARNESAGRRQATNTEVTSGYDIELKAALDIAPVLPIDLFNVTNNSGAQSAAAPDANALFAMQGQFNTAMGPSMQEPYAYGMPSYAEGQPPLQGPLETSVTNPSLHPQPLFATQPIPAHEMRVWLPQPVMQDSFAQPMQFVPLRPAQLQEARPKEASTTLPKIDLPVKTHLFDHRRTGKLRLLSEGGKILAYGSCLDVEYRSAKEFETAVLSEQSLWEEAFAMESLSRNHSHKESMTSTEAVFAKYKAKQDLQMFLSTVRLNKKQHDAYTLRYTLRPCAAQQINCNNARIAALGDAYVGTLRDELQQENDDLLDNPQSWIATDLRIREYAHRTRYVGSDIVLVLQKSLSYKVERETLSSWKSSYRALHQRESGLLDQYHSHFKKTNANQF